MKYNNHFLHNLKKNNILYISSLIILILFSLCFNYQFKEGFKEGLDRTETDIETDIANAKKNILKPEELGSSDEITMEEFLSGKEGDKRKGYYKQIIKLQNELYNVRRPKNYDTILLDETRTLDKHNQKIMMFLNQQTALLPSIDFISKVYGIDTGIMDSDAGSSVADAGSSVAAAGSSATSMMPSLKK